MRAYRVLKGCLVGLVGAAAVAACSGKEAPAKGQIMVVLQSDMAIPKDFNRVRVDISVRGQKVFSDTYVADVTGSLVLPGTIAVVAGEEETPSVEVKVVGISMSNEAQTFSKVITTMPRTRIATLRVPMQWLCTGQTIQLGKGVDAEYESSCQPEGGVERSCVAGECVDVHVNEADLPTYSAPEVFGGGEYANDPSGKCFDVQACFKLGVDLAPDLDPESPTYCQASVAVPNGFDVNFAVNTGPAGAGVCDDADEAAPCFVVLDQSETFGWKAAEGEGPPAMVVDGGGGTSAAGNASGDTAGSSSIAPIGGASGVAGGANAGGAPFGGSGPGPGQQGYYESGSWHGHVVLQASPPETEIKLTTSGAGFPFCVQGTVAPMPDSSGFAALTFNLNQAAGQEPGSVLPSNELGGIQLNLVSQETTPFRLGLAGPDAFSMPLQNWCAPIGATEQLVPWSSFSNQCWLGQEGPYDAGLDDVTSVSIIVPGSPEPLPFEFCVHQLAEANIAQRVAPGQKTLSLVPPGVKPQQAGRAEGSVIVQFPSAVCDRLNDDPTLKLRGTAACDKKTEQTPICGPWSSVQAPQVPNPGGVLPGGDVAPSEGGAGGGDGSGGASSNGEGGMPVDSGGSAQGGSAGASSAGKSSGGTGGASHPMAMCDAAPVNDVTNGVIADFDSDQPEPLIDTFDGRTGYAFSVAYGACEPGTFGKVKPGAQSTFGGLRVALPACNSGGENAVGVFVPFNSSMLESFNGGQVDVPELVCPYDANPYQNLQFYAKASSGQALRVAVVTADTLSVDDQIPGGKCVSDCVLDFQSIDVGVGWLGYPISMAALEIDRSQLLGLLISPLSPSPAMQLDFDEIQFGGLP